MTRLGLTGNHDGGSDALRDAAVIAKQSSERWWDAQICRLRGLVALSGGEVSESEAWLLKSLQTAQQQRLIAPDDGGADVFAHVRDFASPIGGIERGDPVSCVVTTDDRTGKPRARSIMRLPKEQFTGTVTAYSVGRGFGFIAPDSSFLDDVYVYESNLKASGIDKLETGDRVSFELLPKHPAKPRRLAVNLQIMESSQG